MCTCCNGNLDKVKNYITDTKFVVLGTISKEGTPELRTLASFANDGFEVYFSTNKNSAKVQQIQENPSVTLLFQHEGQLLPAFKNVAYQGNAKEIVSNEDFDNAVKILSERSPKFKERAENGQLGDTLIFKVEPVKLKVLDFSAGVGPQVVKEISF